MSWTMFWESKHDREHFLLDHVGIEEGGLLGAAGDVIPGAVLEGGDGGGRSEKLGHPVLVVDARMNLHHLIEVGNVAFLLDGGGAAGQPAEAEACTQCDCDLSDIHPAAPMIQTVRAPSARSLSVRSSSARAPSGYRLLRITAPGA